MLTRVTRRRAAAGSVSSVSASRTDSIGSVGRHVRTGPALAAGRRMTGVFKISKDTVGVAAIVAGKKGSVKKGPRRLYSTATVAAAAVASRVARAGEDEGLGSVMVPAPILSTAETAAATIATPTTTTATTTAITTTLAPHELLEQGLQHLRTVSPHLSRWIDGQDYTRILTQHLRAPTEAPDYYFRSLARGIIGQQVSSAAARSIVGKFVGLFTPPSHGDNDDFFPSPAQVLSEPLSVLRSAGLSVRKCEYMHSLANAFLEDATLSELHTLSDEAIIERLTKVKGIGVWSVEMLLIWTLGRWDVFSIGDLGIQRGMAVWDGRDVQKLKTAPLKKTTAAKKWRYMSEQDMKRLSEPFRPWRSLFCLVMWRASDIAKKVPGPKKVEEVEGGDEVDEVDMVEEMEEMDTGEKKGKSKSTGKGKGKGKAGAKAGAKAKAKAGGKTKG